MTEDVEYGMRYSALIKAEARRRAMPSILKKYRDAKYSLMMLREALDGIGETEAYDRVYNTEKCLNGVWDYMRKDFMEVILDESAREDLLKDSRYCEEDCEEDCEEEP